MCDHSPNREAAMVVISDGIWCDPCLVPLVKALNDGSIRTVASCCGHGKNAGSIALADGRWLVIADEPPSRDQTEDGLAERRLARAWVEKARMFNSAADQYTTETGAGYDCGIDRGRAIAYQQAADELRALLADQSDTTASEEDQR